MSFITESKKAYRQVEALEKETSDHEISMARGELEAIADKATQLASMLQGKSDTGNPLEAWVQSKITKAKDYITSVHDYLKYTPGMNESFDLEENTFEKIYQMQQDGKTAEDIAKELKLNPALVKKVLGEQVVLKEFTDAMLAALKKEYDPLKGKTITTSQYQQLKNILFKLKDGDLEKLQKQNIPFASTGAGSILRVRKSPVKITSVKVPGLEGMAEEKIPQDYLDYLRTIVYKKIDFYEIPPEHIIQHWRDEKNKDRFTGKIIDYKEAIDMSKVTKYKMISIKGDQKEITIDREDLEKHLKLGYVIKEPLTEETFKDNIVNKLVKPVQDYNKKAAEKRTIDMTDGSAHVRFPKDDTRAMEFYKSKGYKVTTKYEETELEEACWTGYKKVGMKKKGDQMVPNCVPEGYVTESGDIVEFVELDEGQFKDIDVRKGDLKLAKDKKENLKNKYNAIMANQANGDENAIADQIQKLDMSIKKQEQELIDIMKKQKETKKEEVELKEKPIDTKDLIKTIKDLRIDDLKVSDDKNFIHIVKEFDSTIDKLNDVKSEYMYIIKTLNKKGINYKPNANQDIENDKDQEYMQINFSVKKEEVELKVEKVNKGAKALVEAITTLQNKADKSGMSYSILKQVYDRGMAAWKGGHRPGAGQHQWAFARVNSFVTKSSGTWGGADSDLAKKVKGKE